MLLLVSVLLATTPAITIDGKPVPDEEVRYYFSAIVNGPLTRLPDSRNLLTGWYETDILVTVRLGEKAALAKGLALSPEALKKVPRADPKAPDTEAPIVLGAPVRLPRNEIERAVIKRALLVEAFVAQSGVSRKPTPEDRDKVLAESPELGKVRETMTVECIGTRLADQKKHRKAIADLVAQGKSLDEIVKTLELHPSRPRMILEPSSEDFGRFIASPNKPLIVSTGVACQLVVHEPERNRTEAELKEHVDPYVEAWVEDRAWVQLFGPLAQKAKIVVDKKRVEELAKAAGR